MTGLGIPKPSPVLPLSDEMSHAFAEMQAGLRRNLPHGYIAQSASDLMLFTNPLIQDTLPADWENR